MKIFGKRHWKFVLAVTVWFILGANLALAADSLPPRAWANVREGGNNGNDIGYSVAIDSQGNIITAGYRTGLSNHAIDAYAVKYDPYGNVLCTIQYDSGPKGGTGGADSSDVFAVVKVDSEDNIFLAGTTSGDYYALGYWTAPYIRKYDKNCNPLWAQPVIINYDPWNSAWQNSQDIAFDKDGNIYVTGAVFGYWGGPEGEWAIWKLDKDGKIYSGFPILYNFSSGSGSYTIPDYSYGIAVDSVGNIIVAGMRGVSGCDGCLDKNYDWHVRKYDPSRALLWEDTYSGAANLLDYAYKVAVDSKDDIIVIGYTNKGTDNSTNANYDWLVIKYAKDGVEGVGQRLWTKTYESAPGRVEQALNVTVDGSDNAVVAGTARDATNSHNMGRVALLSGKDGSQLDEIVFPETDLLLYGVARRGNLLAVSGQVLNSNYDIFTAFLPWLLTTPTQGTQYEPFSKQTITWDKTYISGKSKINLLYSTDSGGTWTPIIEGTANKGKYIWSVPDISPAESFVDTCMIVAVSVDSGEFVPSPPFFSIGFPKITDFNNKKVFVGEFITITGQFFGDKTGKVNFGKGKAKVAAGDWTQTSIRVQVPAKNVLSGPFSISTAAKNTAASPGNLVILPKITKVSPTSGSAGKKVSILGNGFGTTAGSVTFFDNIYATVVTWTDTKISVLVPDGAATGPIRVTNTAADYADSPTFTIID